MRRATEIAPTVFFMHFLDPMHILPLSTNCIVIEHIAISESSELGTRELRISTEVKPMNSNSKCIDDVESQ
jgi:hypothetical protein